MGDGRKSHNLLVGKLEGKHAPGRPKIRREDNFIWDLEAVDYECDWKTLAQNRVTWCASVLEAMNLRVS